MKKVLSILLFIFISFGTTPKANAQCSMCTLNAENGAKNGNTQTKGINKGVFILLSLPFLLTAGGGLIWYTKFRKSTVV